MYIYALKGLPLKGRLLCQYTPYTSISTKMMKIVGKHEMATENTTAGVTMLLNGSELL